MMLKLWLIRIAFFAIMGRFVISCNSEVEVLTYINRQEPFSLRYSPAGKSSVLDLKNIDIPPGSAKHLKLIAWFEANVDGWQRQSNVTSYHMNIVVSQKNITLLCWLQGESVVLFIGNGGEKKEYSKALKRKELDFLVEDF